MRSLKFEDYKEQGNKTKHNHSRSRRRAFRFISFHEPRFKNKGSCGGNKENCYINPVGRFSDDAVVCAEKHGNQ